MADVQTRELFTLKVVNGDGDTVIMYPKTTGGQVLIDANTTLVQFLTSLQQQIQAKADAPIYRSSSWLAANDPVPNSGQFVIESNTNRLKIGDGLTPYSALSYLDNGGTAINGDGTVQATASNHTVNIDIIEGGSTIPIDVETIEAFTPENESNATEDAYVLLKVN